MQSSGNKSTRRDAPRCGVLRIAIMVPIVAVAIAFAGACRAEDEARVKAGVAAWRSSGCSECHGPFADGEKERDEAPTGANLRTTRLDDATLAETIRCGRPGTGMPSFGEDAYARGCYGQPAGPAPEDL